MRKLLCISAATALAACTNAPRDRSTDEVNAADTEVRADREGTRIHIDRNGARANIDGSEVILGRNGLDVDLGANAVEATIRADENGAVTLTTNRR